MSSLTFNLVIYHGNCPDGSTGAWTFWNKFGYAARYMPYGYGKDPPDVTGLTVAIVDFSFKKETLLKMAAQAKYLVILDHHASAERNLKDLDLKDKGELIFDMGRSGAQIAWDYLWDSPRPWFVDYVADRDRWVNKLPHTKEISAAMFFYGYFEDFNKLDELYSNPNDENTKGRLIQHGSILQEYREREILSYAKTAKPAIFTAGGEEYMVRITCCPYTICSDVGNRISSTMDCDFSVTYWYDYWANTYKLSFRGSDSCEIDLSKVAGELGGGGHPKASGATINGNTGENLYTYFKH